MYGTFCKLFLFLIKVRNITTSTSVDFYFKNFEINLSTIVLLWIRIRIGSEFNDCGPKTGLSYNAGSGLKSIRIHNPA
jgi:hypothetical protein